MDDDGQESVAVGAEKAHGAAVLRSLAQAYLKGIGSLDSGIKDAVWELGVSRSTVWRWIKRLTEEGASSRLCVALCLTQADVRAELACDIHGPQKANRRVAMSITRAIAGRGSVGRPVRNGELI